MKDPVSFSLLEEREVGREEEECFRTRSEEAPSTLRRGVVGSPGVREDAHCTPSGGKEKKVP